MKSNYFKFIMLLLSTWALIYACDNEKISISFKKMSLTKNTYEVNFSKIVGKNFECVIFLDKEANDTLINLIGDSIVLLAKSIKVENGVIVVLLNKDGNLVYSETIEKPAILIPFTFRNRKYCTTEYKFLMGTDKAGSKKFIIPFKRFKS